jgi:Ca-activated chloride channel family protein
MLTTNSLRFLLVSLLFCLALSFSTPPKVQAQEDDDVVRTNTDLVVLNVTVTDKAGQYVRALKAKDFKVYENGTEVPIGALVSFGFQDSPYAAVVLLDSSGSMETRLSLARSAAIRFLDGLREEDVAAVYRFDSKVERIQEFSGERDLAPMGYAVKAKGMTTLNDAIVQAAKVLGERPETRRAIVVLSDGMDTFSKATTSKALESALSVGASIYAVDMSALDTPGFNNRQSAAQLKEFSDKTGGRFVATPGGQALRDAFSSIAEELGHQYTIAYRPINTSHDGKWRELAVKVDGEGFVVRTRKGYRAPKK